VTAIDRGCKFNAGYYVSKVLTPLPEWWCGHRDENIGNLTVHANDARPHRTALSQQFMAGNAMVIAVHPRYPRDLAPSDFCVSGNGKVLLRGTSFEIGEPLLSAVESIVGALKSEL
jgi:hypothetical protein